MGHAAARIILPNGFPKSPLRLPGHVGTRLQGAEGDILASPVIPFWRGGGGIRTHEARKGGTLQGAWVWPLPYAASVFATTDLYFPPVVFSACFLNASFPSKK